MVIGASIPLMSQARMSWLMIGDRLTCAILSYPLPLDRRSVHGFTRGQSSLRQELKGKGHLLAPMTALPLLRWPPARNANQLQTPKVDLRP